jgi:hypothetical protein
MKTAVIPQIRVEPELRAELESVLRQGETLTEFVETTVRSAIAFRRVQTAFHARAQEASEAYSKITGHELEQVGFCTHDRLEYLAMSPDRLTPDRTGGIEVKCPSTKTHIRTIRMGGLPNDYKYQVYQYFLVNEKLQWLDFVSYDPRFTPRPLYIHRIERNDIIDELNTLEAEVVKFWAKFEKYYNQVTF